MRAPQLAQTLLNCYLPAVPNEAFMNKFGREAPNHISGNIVLFQFFKLEFDGAGRLPFGIDGCYQITVNVPMIQPGSTPPFDRQ
jgi:hypothetical protein